MAGTYYSPVFNYLEVKVKMCTGSGCASDADINAFLADAKLNIAFVNGYFDASDYKKPIKLFLDDTSFWDL